MPVQARHHRFKHERLAFGAAMLQGGLNGEPARNRVVAIDDFAGDAERLAAVERMFAG